MLTWIDYLDIRRTIHLRSTCLKLRNAIPIQILWNKQDLEFLVELDNLEAVCFRTRGPSRRWQENKRAVQVSAENGPRLSILKTLLFWDPINYSRADIIQDTFLAAAQFNQPEKLDFIISYSRHTGHEVHIQDKIHGIWRACEGRFLEIIKLIVAIDPGQLGTIAIKYASEKGSLEIVQYLCTLRQVNPAGDGNHCLLSACFFGHLELVRFLCSLNLDPAFPNNNPLKEAVARNHLDIVRFLFSLQRPEIDPSVDLNHCIREACYRGHLEMVRYLTTFPKVDPTVSDNCCIRYASHQGHVEVVKFLMTFPGVDPTTGNNSCMREACGNGHLAVVKYLTTCPRIDPANGKNSHLAHACAHGHLEVVRFLMTFPSVVNIFSKERFPLHLAEYYKHDKVGKFLRSFPCTAQ